MDKPKAVEVRVRDIASACADEFAGRAQKRVSALSIEEQKQLVYGSVDAVLRRMIPGIE